MAANIIVQKGLAMRKPETRSKEKPLNFFRGHSDLGIGKVFIPI
jgi:hypothetical protein